MPCRYFREKLEVLIPLCLLGGCVVDAIWKAHKRTLFGNFALVLINQSFSLNYSCCSAASRGTFLQSSVRIVKMCGNRSFSSLGCAVVIVEQTQKCWWRASTVGNVASDSGCARCWVPAKLVVVVLLGVRHAAKACTDMQLTCMLLNMRLKSWVTLSSCDQVSKSQGLRTEEQHSWL